VKSATPIQEEKVKFPTPPAPEKVKSENDKPLESLLMMAYKVVEAKEREKKGAPLAPVSLWPEKAERRSPYWCETHGFIHSERMPDHRPDCWLE